MARISTNRRGDILTNLAALQPILTTEHLLGSDVYNAAANVAIKLLTELGIDAEHHGAALVGNDDEAQ